MLGLRAVPVLPATPDLICYSCLAAVLNSQATLILAAVLGSRALHCYAAMPDVLLFRLLLLRPIRLLHQLPLFSFYTLLLLIRHVYSGERLILKEFYLKFYIKLCFI